MNIHIPSPIQQLHSAFLKEHEIELWMKRDDLIHEVISGNKWRKLKFNVLKAKDRGNSTLLTFGGAYSNHIVATAAACERAGIKSIGIIRGEEVLPLNRSLQQAKDFGMQLEFVSREDYSNKEMDWYIQELRLKFGSFHLVPEGGANFYGVMGCMEIMQEIDESFDVLCCAAGTGTTLCGLLLGKREKVKVLGFPALKGGDFLRDNVRHLLNYSVYEKEEVEDFMNDLELITKFHFGGYAKIKDELVEFVNAFNDTYAIPLDLVYTGKMMFGLFHLIQEGRFKPGTKIMAVHTGGLQGNRGMKERLGAKLNY